MSKSSERLLAFLFGTVIVIVMLTLAMIVRDPTPLQYTVFRIVLALAASGVAAMIPGFIHAQIGTIVRAGGALAVFVIVYFFSPAGLVKTELEIELDQPLVNAGTYPNALSVIQTAHSKDGPRRIDVLRVTDEGSLATAGTHRYDKLIIDNVRAKLPPGSVIVANDIEGIGAAAFVGTDFSIVARRVSNLTIDTSGEQIPSAEGGNVALYVKQVTNSKLFARGANGRAGEDGEAGARGADGAHGRSGNCDGFGRYRMAQIGGDGADGGNGGDGAPGGDGKPGGRIMLLTLVNPIASQVDVSGGIGGAGGRGGEPGAGGRGGRGGSGCVGLGGSQPTKSNGRDGKPGVGGADGKRGADGAPGEYRLVLVKSFDEVAALLDSSTNEELYRRLRTL